MITERQDIELDSGPRARAAERLCVATRTVRPVSDLIRFVVGPEGDAVPDVKRRLPGRGIWVTATQEALDEAIRRKAFARGFKREVRLPSDLVARTERQLERAALDALAIAGKAGLVVAGFAKAEAALERGNATALLHAAEASPEGIRKLDSALRRGPGGSLPVIGFLTSAQLDLALNRPNVVHAALLAGPVSETFLARCRRLERFRAGDQHNRAGMAGPE
ncbi:MAG TPA: RNA-binding protein [Xanthobacteraceae bacterium]|nr:RNA-binding protein [Xanthobacteraceae bacterium]